MFFFRLFEWKTFLIKENAIYYYFFSGDLASHFCRAGSEVAVRLFVRNKLKCL
jgi:hypothetical protein